LSRVRGLKKSTSGEKKEKERNPTPTEEAGKRERVGR